MNTATVQLKVGEFDVAVSSYSENILMIIHNSIRGVGNIFYIEKEGNTIVCDQLLGIHDEMLTLFANKLAEQFTVRNVTLILAFHPSKMQSFDAIRGFIEEFQEASKEKFTR